MVASKGKEVGNVTVTKICLFEELMDKRCFPLLAPTRGPINLEIRCLLRLLVIHSHPLEEPIMVGDGPYMRVWDLKYDDRDKVGQRLPCIMQASRQSLYNVALRF
jgi:hypothetical protein